MTRRWRVANEAATRGPAGALVGTQIHIMDKCNGTAGKSFERTHYGQTRTH
jgi:hypothetical protein